MDREEAKAGAGKAVGDASRHRLATDPLPANIDMIAVKDGAYLRHGVSAGLYDGHGKSINPVGEAHDILRIEAAHGPEFHALQLPAMRAEEDASGSVDMAMDDATVVLLDMFEGRLTALLTEIVAMQAEGVTQLKRFAVGLKEPSCIVKAQQLGDGQTGEAGQLRSFGGQITGQAGVTVVAAQPDTGRH